MKTSGNRNSNRSLTQGLRATFGPIALPQAGRKSLLALGTACLLITGAASADWRVYDTRVEAVLQRIEGKIGGSDKENDKNNVNKHLQDLNHRFDVKGTVYDPEAAGQDTDDTGNKTKLADAPDMPNSATTQSRQCGNGKTPGDQNAVCKQIVKLEQERYKYLQAMRKLSEKRSGELKAIYEERRDIEEDEYGKLQSNTNRLLMLLAQQRIDELNLQMAMATFDARLRDRKEQNNHLAEVAMDPSKKQLTSPGDVLGNIIGGYARTQILDKALDLAGKRER